MSSRKRGGRIGIHLTYDLFLLLNLLQGAPDGRASTARGVAEGAGGTGREGDAARGTDTAAGGGRAQEEDSACKLQDQGHQGGLGSCHRLGHDADRRLAGVATAILQVHRVDSIFLPQSQGKGMWRRLIRARAHWDHRIQIKS
jgi:hypothetical protein